jgi:transcriptional regulator with XRE-family HTH domain
MDAMPRKSRLKLPPLDLGKETLGERLARIRKEKGVTQVELAARVGIVQNLVSAYECGRLRLQAEMVIRFARELGVSADELLGLKKPAQEAGTVTNRRLRRHVQEIEKLPRRDQEALLRTIEAFLAKAG